MKNYNHIFLITNEQAIALRIYENTKKHPYHLVYARVPSDSSQCSDYVMSRRIEGWDKLTKFYTTAEYINNIPRLIKNK